MKYQVPLALLLSLLLCRPHVAGGAECIKTVQMSPLRLYELYTLEGKVACIETYEKNMRTDGWDLLKREGTIPEGIVTQQLSPLEYRTWTYRNEEQTGPYEVYLKSESSNNSFVLREQGVMKRNLRHGTVSYWNADRVLERKELYHEGQLMKLEKFNVHGIVVERQTFKEDQSLKTIEHFNAKGVLIHKKDTLALEEKYYSPKGILRSHFKLYPNLTLKERRHYTPKSKRGLRSLYSEEGFLTNFQVPHEPMHGKEVVDKQVKTDPFFLTHFVRPGMTFDALEDLFILQGKESGSIAIRAIREKNPNPQDVKVEFDEWFLNQPMTITYTFRKGIIEEMEYRMLGSKQEILSHFNSLKKLLIYYFEEPKRTHTHQVSWDSIALKAMLVYVPFEEAGEGIYKVYLDIRNPLN